MTTDLNSLAPALRDAPPDRDLTTVEPLVWRRLEDDAGWAFFGPSLSPAGALLAARMSLGALALAAGLLVGAAGTGMTPEIGELAVFSAEAPFGPSSLLSRL